jgi:hypothetical protein
MHAKPAVEAQAALAARNFDGLDGCAHVMSRLMLPARGSQSGRR